MVNNRPLVETKGSRKRPRAKRIKNRVAQLERQLQAIKPEVKYIRFDNLTSLTASTLLPQHVTGIAQGTTSFERAGLEVGVVGISVRGYCHNVLDYKLPASGIDVYLIRNDDSSVPVAADFGTACGGQYSHIKGKEYFHQTTGVDGTYEFEIYFDIPKKVQYNGSTAGSFERGTIWFVIINRNTTDSVATQYSCRTMFIDS